MNYFIWKGADSRTKGMRLKSPLPIIRPEERVEHIQIPGRAGDLTQTEGEDIYNSYIQTASISVDEASHVRDVFAWLRGEGWLISSSEPDRRQRARVIGAITLDKVSKYLDIWTGECQFYCQPLKELLNEETVTVTPGGTVTNRGDVTSCPLMKVTASGETVDLSCGWTDGSTAGLTQITVTGLNSGAVIWIDSETLEIWNEAKTAMLTIGASGEFPRLHPGENTISGTGWSQAVITRRERYL